MIGFPASSARVTAGAGGSADPGGPRGMWKYAEYKEPQMKISQSILLSLTLAAGFALTGCGRQDKDTPLAFVPADTAYVFANIKPLPDAVSRAWFDRLEPLNAALGESVAALRAELAGNPAAP